MAWFDPVRYRDDAGQRRPDHQPEKKNLDIRGNRITGEFGQRGVLEAWDPVNQKLAWRVPDGGASGGGTVTTAGNLVFQVVGDGRLLAYSADKGEKLLEIRANRPGAAPPITYMVDGKQYIAFLSGTGRPPQTVGPTDAKTDSAPMLFAFELGGTAALPPPPPPRTGPLGSAPPPPPAAEPTQQPHQ
ncbi:MAG: PQQ-binding-like beta-propeller repeat protein [Acidobacteriia bacterium]|nr:PQQ-binding-like beta-propeller repeat protein [Terriglobia bacterium]